MRLSGFSGVSFGLIQLHDASDTTLDLTLTGDDRLFKPFEDMPDTFRLCPDFLDKNKLTVRWRPPGDLRYSETRLLDEASRSRLKALIVTMTHRTKRRDPDFFDILMKAAKSSLPAWKDAGTFIRPMVSEMARYRNVVYDNDVEPWLYPDRYRNLRAVMQRLVRWAK